MGEWALLTRYDQCAGKCRVGRVEINLRDISRPAASNDEPSYLYNLRGLYLVPVTRLLDRVLHEATYPLALCLWCVQPAFGAYGVGLASKKNVFWIVLFINV